MPGPCSDVGSAGAHDADQGPNTNEPEARLAFASLGCFQHWDDIVSGV